MMITKTKQNSADITHVTVAILRYQHRYLINLRPKSTHLGGLYEFIGGKIKNETAQTALLREIKEELFLDVSDAALIHMGKAYHQYDKCICLHVFAINLLAHHVLFLQDNWQYIQKNSPAITRLTWATVNELGCTYPMPSANMAIINRILPHFIRISRPLAYFANIKDYLAYYAAMVGVNDAHGDAQSYMPYDKNASAGAWSNRVQLHQNMQNKPNNTSLSIPPMQSARIVHASDLPKSMHNDCADTALYLRTKAQMCFDKNDIQTIVNIAKHFPVLLPFDDYIHHQAQHKTVWDDASILAVLNAKHLKQGISFLQTLPKSIRYFASCHSQDDVQIINTLAKTHAVAGVFLSPVLPTKSHKGAPNLGWSKFGKMCQYCDVPVFALGGLQKSDLPIAVESGAYGVAGITGFIC